MDLMDNLKGLSDISVLSVREMDVYDYCIIIKKSLSYSEYNSDPMVLSGV